MPKGKRKYKSGGRPKQDPSFGSEEESVADTVSVVSNLSDLGIDSDEPLETEDEVITVDHFEDRLKEAIEGTSQKSAKGRTTALEVIIKSLTSKFICDFILDRKVTLCDVAERSLRRGKGSEQVLGATVGSLLCTQLGSVEGGSEEVFLYLQPTLSAMLTDNSVQPQVRAQCALSLGLCCFISCMGSEVIQTVMDSLFSVLGGSLVKGGAPSLRPEVTSLHSNALQGWALLLTTLSPPYIHQLTNTHLRKLPQLLDSTDVDLRIAAGETLAVFYELARQVREDFEGFDLDGLCDKLRLLATDSQKFRAKKDRRQQRSSFRDILRAIEEREPLDVRVRLGDETLYIDNWCHKRQYDAFCQVLGTGMNLHLRQNDLLREIFQLGTPLLDEKQTGKSSKLERHSAHLAADKERTKCLSKLRDKRADIC